MTTLILALFLTIPEPVRVQAVFDRLCIHQRNVLDTCMATNSSLAANDSVMYLRLDTLVLAARVLKLRLSIQKSAEEVGQIYAIAPGMTILVEMFYRRFYITIRSREFTGTVMLFLKMQNQTPYLYYK